VPDAEDNSTGGPHVAEAVFESSRDPVRFHSRGAFGDLSGTAEPEPNAAAADPGLDGADSMGTDVARPLGSPSGSPLTIVPLGPEVALGAVLDEMLARLHTRALDLLAVEAQGGTGGGQGARFRESGDGRTAC
jgi:hypothetical protein